MRSWILSAPRSTVINKFATKNLFEAALIVLFRRLNTSEGYIPYRDQQPLGPADVVIEPSDRLLPFYHFVPVSRFYMDLFQ